MSHINQIFPQVNSSVLLPKGTQLKLSFSHVPLMVSGFNMPISVSATKTSGAEKGTEIQSATVIAHFDTGARKTSIDVKLAEFLGLVPVGISTIHTAAGPAQMPDYAVDISFPMTDLSPFSNLPVSSCHLPLEIENGNIALTPKNFGVLIGRDIMSRWNIVWNGPTSTVLISD